MQVLSSKIFDFINNCLCFIQTKADVLRNRSILLLNIDYFILLSIFVLYTVSTFMGNGITALFAFLTISLVVIKTLITKGEKLELRSSDLCLLVYLLICLTSNFTSSLPVQSFYGFSKTLLYFAFYFAMCQFLKNKKQFIIPILAVIALLVSIESIIGLIQNMAGVASIATWQDTSYVNPEDVLTRVYGTLKPYNPNLFGGWLIAGVPSLAALSFLLFYKKKILPAVISSAAFLISVLCIFFTGCRSAYIALFAIILSILIALFKINKRCKVAAVSVAMAGFLFIILHHGILKRLMSIFIMRGDSSTSFRMNVYHSAVQMFQDNPVWGIGVGNKVFREIYGLYMISGFDALSCYCVFLEMAVESGIFSLVTFLIFLGITLTSGIRKYISSNDVTEKILLFTAFVSVIAVMIHGFTDTVYFRPQIQFIFWTMVSVLTVLSTEQTSTKHDII